MSHETNVDLAHQLEEQQRELAIARRVRPPAIPAVVNLNCRCCPGDIEPGRAALGYTTCIYCQQLIEAGSLR